MIWNRHNYEMGCIVDYMDLGDTVVFYDDCIYEVMGYKLRIKSDYQCNTEIFDRIGIPGHKLAEHIYGYIPYGDWPQTKDYFEMHKMAQLVKEIFDRIKRLPVKGPVPVFRILMDEKLDFPAEGSMSIDKNNQSTTRVLEYIKANFQPYNEINYSKPFLTWYRNGRYCFTNTSTKAQYDGAYLESLIGGAQEISHGFIKQQSISLILPGGDILPIQERYINIGLINKKQIL